MIHKEWYKKTDTFGLLDLFSPNFWRMALAEFIGTFIVIFVGLMCKVTIIEKFTPTIERQGLGWGFAVASMSLVVGHLSGGHLNPVISLALMFSGGSSVVRSFFFIMMQISAGMYAGVLFQYCLPEDHVGEYAVLWHNHAVEPIYGFFVEMFATVPLVLLCCSLKDQNRVDFRGSGALAIGFYYTASHQCFWFYTGACLNPVRALAPAFATAIWDHHWVYWAGPIAGGLIGGIMYPLLFRVNKAFLEEQKEKVIARQANLCPEISVPRRRREPKPPKPPTPKPKPEIKAAPSRISETKSEEEEPHGKKGKSKKKTETDEPPAETQDVAGEEPSSKKKKKKNKEAEAPPPPPPPPPPLPPAQEEEGGKKKKKK